jgi:multiple sugar transport system ATP-binding protein
MRTEIKKLHARLGKTIIYVTHDQVEAMTLADRIAVLSGGKVIQYATPDEIYNRPAAKFVAGFTGSPAMNFATAIIASDGASAQIGDVTIALPDSLRNANAACRGKAVDLGIRPEDISVDRTATTMGSVVPATVVVTEPLGAETLVTLRIGGAEFVARARPDVSLRAGDSVQAQLASDKLHLFDAESGNSIR